MESKHYYKYSFNSFGEALDYYLNEEHGRGANKEIAKRLVESFDDDKKVRSWAAQIGQWRNGTQEPQHHNIKKLNEVLNVRIGKDHKGKWRIARTHPEGPSEFEPGDPTIEEMLAEYKSRKEHHGFSDSERGQLLLNLLNDAESLTTKLRQLIELEKNRPDE